MLKEALKRLTGMISSLMCLILAALIWLQMDIAVKPGWPATRGFSAANLATFISSYCEGSTWPLYPVNMSVTVTRT